MLKNQVHNMEFCLGCVFLLDKIDPIGTNFIESNTRFVNFWGEID